jgi:hypothetical protein
MNRTFKFKNKSYRTRQDGQVLIATVILFLTLSLVVVMAMSVPIANEIKVGSDLETSRRSYATAEVGNEEIYYRLNKNKTIPATITLGVSVATTTANVVTSGDSRIVTATGLAGTYQRLIRTVFTRPRDVAINYAMLIGTSTVTGSNQADISGDVYSNGSLSDLHVTGGSVTAANIINPTTVESFDMSTSSSGLSNIVFWKKNNGGVPDVEDLAQSFKISSATPINAVSLVMKKTANNFNSSYIKIVNDVSGHPGPTVYGTATFPSGSVSTSGFGSPYLTFNSTVNLTPGVTYWIVVDVPSPSSNSASLFAEGVQSATANYSNGNVKTGVWNSTNGGTGWITASSTTNDVFFNLYYNGTISSLTNITTAGSPYFQWAREIYNSNAGTGITYCKNSSGTTPATCDTSRPDPSAAAFPVTTTDYTSWESLASSGLSTSSIAMDNNDNRTLGNTKINGNLSIDRNSHLYLTGNLWITGNLSIDNNSSIEVASSQGEKDLIVLVDGSITMYNGAGSLGSGNPNSFLLLVTRCTLVACPSGSVIVNNTADVGPIMAQFGKVVLDNNATAKAIMASGAELRNNSDVVYDPKLQFFSLGSDGGTTNLWSIDSWQEVSE